MTFALIAFLLICLLAAGLAGNDVEVSGSDHLDKLLEDDDPLNDHKDA